MINIKKVLIKLLKITNSNNKKQTKKLKNSADKSQNVVASDSPIIQIQNNYAVDTAIIQAIHPNITDSTNLETAKNEGEENFKKYANLVKEQTSEISIKGGALEKALNSFDFQCIAKKSGIAAARIKIEELQKLLAILLRERINNNSDDLYRIAYNEAIEITPKLTIDQLKILALCYFLRIDNMIWHLDEWDQLYKKLELDFIPFIDLNSCHDAFKGIHPACGFIQRLFNLSFIRVLKKRYMTQLLKVNIADESIKKKIMDNTTWGRKLFCVMDTFPFLLTFELSLTGQLIAINYIEQVRNNGGYGKLLTVKQNNI